MSAIMGFNAGWIFWQKGFKKGRQRGLP